MLAPACSLSLARWTQPWNVVIVVVRCHSDALIMKFATSFLHENKLLNKERHPVHDAIFFVVSLASVMSLPDPCTWCGTSRYHTSGTRGQDVQFQTVCSWTSAVPALGSGHSILVLGAMDSPSLCGLVEEQTSGHLHLWIRSSWFDDGVRRRFGTESKLHASPLPGGRGMSKHDFASSLFSE